MHFDHFFSKSKYPFLSLSYFNLIPCCSTCNTTKSSKEFNTKDYIHPYLNSLNDKFNFTTDKMSIIDMILKGEKSLDNVSIIMSPKKGFEEIVNRHDEAFNLTEIYNEHKDVVFEVYSKQYIYTDAFVETLQKTFSKEFSEKEIEKFLLGNYTLTSEINNRPLSKLMQDILSDAKKGK